MSIMDEDSQFQDILKLTIDILGYNMRAIENRRTFMNGMSKNISQLLEPSISVHCAGSKAEGMTVFLEKDADLMYVFNDVVCLERDDRPRNLEADVEFEMVLDKNFPGYTKLLLQKMDKDIPFIMEPLYDDKGKTYISSDFFANNVQTLLKQEESKLVAHVSRSGPSCPAIARLKEYSFAMDRVFCFRCDCPTILRKWSIRKRYQKWPTQDMIAHVNTLDAHVVPVGVKGHMLQFTQWRICFTLGETYLLNTLKENMLQVYAIMKETISAVIQPICKEITSYIVKNIVLWIAETLPTDKFDIVPLLMKAILLLKLTVKADYFPSYMIPERNLFQNKLSLHQKLTLDTLLSEMLKERGAMVLRSPRLGREMCFVYGQPELLDERRKTYEMFTRYPSLPHDKLFKQSLPFLLAKQAANEEFSIMDFFASNQMALREVFKSNDCVNSIQQLLRLPVAQNVYHDVVKRVAEDSNILDKIMRLPFTSYSKVAGEILGIKLDCPDIPPEITVGDIFSREEMSEFINPNCLDECISYLPDIMPKLLGCLGAEDTNSDCLMELATTIMNHPEARSCATNMLQFTPYNRYFKGK